MKQNNARAIIAGFWGWLGIMAFLGVPESLATTATVNGVTWTYCVSENAVTVTGANPASGTLTIPSMLGGYPVTSIGDFAFHTCMNLTSVTIPDSVTNIGSFAFADCSMTTVTIPNNVRSIEGKAFFGCSGLTSVTIPNSVTNIERDAFEDCNGLTAVHIHDLAAWCGISFEDNPLHYAHHLYLDGQEVRNLTIPNRVTSIETNAFSGCDGLKSVTIPDSVTNIGRYAFRECSNLETVVIGKKVRTIGNGAFESCANLKSVYITDLAAWCGISFEGTWEGGVHERSFGQSNPLCSADHLYLNGKEIAGALKIPNGVKNIAHGAFSGCNRITSIAIPASVTNIGSFAFAGCGMTTVTIPESVKHIGASTFSDCLKLTTATIHDHDGAVWIFSGCTGLKLLYVPARWKEITVAARESWADDDWDDSTYLEEVHRRWWSVPKACKFVYVLPVKFDAVGGKCDAGIKRYEIGNAFRRLPTPKRKGYVFGGWWTGKNGRGKRVTSTTLVNTGHKVLYSKWVATTYTVKFDANGGILPSGKKMPAQMMTYDKTSRLRKNAFVREGCVFRGWAKTKNGPVVYKNAQAVKNLRTDGKTTTLYAKWARKTYTVAFKANGGKGKMAAQKMIYGKAARLSKNAFSRRGYIFLGWAMTRKGIAAYKDASSVRNLRADGKTATLYAVWEKGQTVKFDANGGTCTTKERDFKVGRVYGGFPVPERTWYSFLGWYTAVGGGKWVSPMDIAETTKTRRLFARWEYLPLRLGATGQTVGPLAAGKLSVALAAKADWTAASDAGWLTVRTKKGKAGTGKLVYDVAANTGGARTGRIIVSAGGKALVFTVVQQARTLKLSASKKVFSRKAAKGQKLGVTATVAWKAESSAKWLALKTAKGKGNGTIVYELAENKKAGRAAKITVTGGGKTASFRVEQKGRDESDPNAVRPTVVHYLQLEPDRQTFDAGGTTNGLSVVMSDIPWKASTSNTWITLGTESGSKTDLLAYQVVTNAGKARTGKITVAGGNLKATLIIEQMGQDDVEPYIAVSPTNRISPAAAAANEAVWVEANVAWTASTSAGWINLKTVKGKGGGKIAYAIPANTSTVSRTGYVTVRGGGMAAVFALTQEGKGKTPEEKHLRVNPGSRMHGNGAASGSFLVEANVGWAVSSSANWIVLNTHSGKDNGSVSYSVAENKNGERRGTITVRGGGLSATFAVGQGGPIVLPPRPAPVYEEFEVVPHWLYPSWEEQELMCWVKSTVNWVATKSGAHIHLGTTAGPAAETSPIFFRVDENPSPHYVQSGHVGARATESLFMKIGVDACHVVQPPKPKFLDIQPHSIAEVPWKGKTGMQCKVYTVNSTQKWRLLYWRKDMIEITDYGFGGGMLVPGYVNFNVTENKDAKDRIGKIIITDGEITSTCVVTQKKGVKLEVTPSHPKHSFDDVSYPWRYELSVMASVDWKVTLVRGGEWFRLHTKRGKKGNYGTIEYQVLSRNESDEPREAAIAVSGGGKTVQVVITQAARDLPNLQFYKPSGWPAAVFVTGVSSEMDINSTKERTTFTEGKLPVPLVRYALKNTGAANAGSYRVHISMVGGFSDTANHANPPLGAGATTNDEVIIFYYYGNVEYFAPPAGSYNVTITLDSGNKVKESNEHDNVTNVTFKVVKGSSSRSAQGSVAKKSSVGVEEEPESIDDFDWVAVTASGNEDAGAVVDGDETTAWETDGTNGAWVVLTFAGPRDVEDVEVVGDNLPEGTRFLLSEDADHWQEGVPGKAQYVWVVFPACEEPLAVKEIRVVGE